jgi:O-antigen/teichoic acid export membrane protein
VQTDVISLKRLLRESVLARNTFWMFGGLGFRMALQAVYFVLIARALGAAEYGAFVGAVSLVALVAPFSSWGMGFILIREVARDRTTFGRYWGAALGVTALFGCALLCLVLLVSHAIWGAAVAFRVLLLVGISDVIVVRILELAVQAFTAVEVLRKSAELYVILAVARAAAAAYLSFVAHSPAALSWAVLYLLSSVAASTYGLFAVSRTVGLPRLGMRFSRAEFREGFYFAVSQASATVHNDIDKTMLVRFGGLGATGIYGAAYRIVDVAFAPVSALVSAASAKFFRHGESGIEGSIRFAKRLLPFAAGYGVLAMVILYAVSPILPVVLGSGFAAATLALRWLSPLVLLKSIHYFFADSLSTAGHQRLRAMVQIGIVGLNVVLNLWLIPAYAWRGAAWASLASDGALAVALLLTIVILRRRANPSDAERGVAAEVALRCQP